MTIQQKIDAAWKVEQKNILAQLEKQDAVVLLDTYKEIIYPSIEQQIKFEANRSNESTEELSSNDFLRNKYQMTNGGFVAYLRPVSGYKPTEVISTGLTTAQTTLYILQNSLPTIGDIFLDELGTRFPYFGAVSNVVATFQRIADAASFASITANGGCAQVINTWSHEFGTKASITTGWSSRFYVVTPAAATNIVYKRF